MSSRRSRNLSSFQLLASANRGGGIGLSHPMETIVEPARRLAGDAGVLFQFVVEAGFRAEARGDVLDAEAFPGRVHALEEVPLEMASPGRLVAVDHAVLEPRREELAAAFEEIRPEIRLRAQTALEEREARFDRIGEGFHRVFGARV